jgi:hypothetical protein
MCDGKHCIVTMWRNGKYVYVCVNCNQEVG